MSTMDHIDDSSDESQIKSIRGEENMSEIGRGFLRFRSENAGECHQE